MGSLIVCAEKNTFAVGLQPGVVNSSDIGSVLETVTENRSKVITVIRCIDYDFISALRNRFTHQLEVLTLDGIYDSEELRIGRFPIDAQCRRLWTTNPPNLTNRVTKIGDYQYVAK